MSTYQPVCDLCGEPMPLGEEMFKYHGYSGPCPKPPKPKPAPPVGAEQWRPIGDAAKSERPVLLGAELPDGTWAYDVGHWATEEERRIQVGDCGGPCRCPEYDLDEPYWVGWSHEGVQPTHYRPLFPPPARRGGEV